MRRSPLVLRPVVAAVTALAITAGGLLAQPRQDNAFTWSGVVPAGRTTLVRNVNGGVRVERATGRQVEITATKRWRRGNPDEVRIEARRIGAGDQDVIVCALWNEQSRCDEDGMHNRQRGQRWSNDNNDVSVEFVVKVPDGVHVDVGTVNGGVEIQGVGGDVVARTVNGDVEGGSTGGPVRARTVNGSVRVRMSTVGTANDLSYETVNGSVTVELPASLGASVDLSTVNGRVSSDFPMTVSGTVSPRRVRATIGDGRVQLRVRTINGSVELRRTN
ncbi:MAG: DUF4097 family beta strand repeat-containing protein [Gemmatimonadaceae bacterium]|jgi:hypothetical protein|nr:DUF4097 family beta strand repeat-containing protein [Gemmatimonadaceae bacterium]